MASRRKRTLVWTITLTLVGVVVMASAYFAFLVYEYNAAVHPVEAVDGYVSVEPGWPWGPGTVDLDARQCGVLDEASLIAAIRAQRHNRSLRDLCLDGQPISSGVVQAVASLGTIESLGVARCELELGTARGIAQINGLRFFDTDATNAETLRDAFIENGLSATRIRVRPVQ